MKKGKRAKAYITKKFGVEAKGVKLHNSQPLNPLAEFGNVKTIRNSPSAQMQLYLSANEEKMEYFFAHGGCFERNVQRRITSDNNLDVLELFLRHWEFEPIERAYMIKHASFEFVRIYLLQKTLGKQYQDLLSCGRFPRYFWQEISGYLPKDIRQKAEELRRI